MKRTPSEQIYEQIKEYNRIISNDSIILETMILQLNNILNDEDEEAIRYKEKMVEIMLKYIIGLEDSAEVEMIIEDIMGNHFDSIYVYENRAFKCGFVDGYNLAKAKYKK